MATNPKQNQRKTRRKSNERRLIWTGWLRCFFELSVFAKAKRVQKGKLAKDKSQPKETVHQPRRKNGKPVVPERLVPVTAMSCIASFCTDGGRLRASSDLRLTKRADAACGRWRVLEPEQQTHGGVDHCSQILSSKPQKLLDKGKGSSSTKPVRVCPSLQRAGGKYLCSSPGPLLGWNAQESPAIVKASYQLPAFLYNSWYGLAKKQLFL